MMAFAANKIEEYHAKKLARRKGTVIEKSLSCVGYKKSKKVTNDQWKKNLKLVYRTYFTMEWDGERQNGWRGVGTMVKKIWSLVEGVILECFMHKILPVTAL